MSDTVYTKPAKGQKWHIQHNKAWTLCYQLCTYWCFWFTSANNTPDGEICQQCQAIDEAIRTGEGVPF